MSDAEQPPTADTGTIDAHMDYEVLRRTQFEFEVYEQNGSGYDTMTVVNRRKGTCECGGDSDDVCQHMEAVVDHLKDELMASDELARWTLSTLVTDAGNAVDRIEEMADEARQMLTALETDVSVDGPTVADPMEPDSTASDSQNDGAPEQEVQDFNAGAADEETVEQLENARDALVSWLGDEQMFEDLPKRPDPDFRPVVADGQRGLALDMAPWDADPEYYDDDEWVDKEQWEDDRDAIRDFVLDHDAVQWYGKPDYEIVVPENAVEEVTD